MPRQLKHPSVRQRGNKSPSAATLYALEPHEIVIPDLPTLHDKDGNEIEWSDMVINWWVDIWSSPMAPEFYKSDIHGLYDMARLKQAFWNGRMDLHSEIRLYEQQFGLNPLARRRLEWQIVETEKALDAEEDRQNARNQRKASAPDPADISSVDPLSA